MAIIHFDGFYYSRPIEWEDWHAGVRMHGEHVHFRRFYPNGIWLGACRDSTFDFWTDSEQLDSNTIGILQRGRGPTDGEANLLWIAGTYEIANERLIQSLAPDCGGGYVWVTNYSIMDDRIVGPLEGENPLTLRFKPTPANMTIR
ncbi:MAG: hypothetical protein JNK90_27355 [Planctomycetaceae bacterium]|nr:hypothetical protein [Planctomycetaceae bacterium]MBN8599809.1 hypothetical protein [Planctomycetota bacterium]